LDALRRSSLSHNSKQEFIMTLSRRTTLLGAAAAVGGAACGVSGSKASGYLSGNGLLTAVGYGSIAGLAAGALTKREKNGD
jgi:hypothetical protein